jgi:hypothetical protein
VKSIGNLDRNGSGIAAAWDMLMLTTTKHYSEESLSRLEEMFGSIIDAIVPDPEVAASAKGRSIASRLGSMMHQGPNSWKILPIP